MNLFRSIEGAFNRVVIYLLFFSKTISVYTGMKAFPWDRGEAMHIKYLPYPF